MRILTARTAFLIFAPILMLAVTGCESFTGIGPISNGLYSDNSFVFRKEPAMNHSVELYRAVANQDMLVVYDEHSERSGKYTRKAFYLYENKRRMDFQREPKFVPVTLTNGMVPVPIGRPVNGAADADYWVEFSNEDREFTLFYNGLPQDKYTLPYYDDKESRALREFLTPPAVLLDVAYYATIVGGVVALYCAYVYCQGGGTINVGKYR